MDSTFCFLQVVVKKLNQLGIQLSSIYCLCLLHCYVSWHSSYANLHQ